MQKNNKIIVIKIGTAVLSSQTGKLDLVTLKSICSQISKVIKTGYKVIIVSSGAISRGMEALKLTRRPNTLSSLQATAAIGQSKLMKIYDDCMQKKGLGVAQVLLTIGDFNDRTRYVNARNTISELLYEFNVVPIINENDTVATEEIKFGDNDKLSALVSNLMQAQQLIILTNVDGLKSSEDGNVIPLVTHITPKIQSMATKEIGKFGSGGMQSKLQAVKIATFSGIACVIANGKKEDAILKIMKGESIGTTFLPKPPKHTGKKRWIAFSSLAHGAVLVDEGAKGALAVKGRSLLAIGVKKVEGNFEASDVIKIKDLQGKEFARGVTNFSSKELNIIKGAKSDQLKTLLKRDINHNEVIHRDNMAVL